MSCGFLRGLSRGGLRPPRTPPKSTSGCRGAGSPIGDAAQETAGSRRNLQEPVSNFFGSTP
eukprot:13749027-Alexandrium_andersonii.AAC.1